MRRTRHESRLDPDALPADLIDPDIRRARTPPAPFYGDPGH